MHRIVGTTVIILSAVLLSGCETVKSTVSGPFVGMKKDVDNIKPKVQQVHPIIAMKRLDGWMQQNMW